jgi:hypothetical protein
LMVRNLASGQEIPITQLPKGNAAMWPQWRPAQSVSP